MSPSLSDKIVIVLLVSCSSGSPTLLRRYVIYTPTLDFFGTDTFTYTITDGVHDDEASVLVQATNVNDPPLAVDDATTTVEETFVSIPVPAIPVMALGLENNHKLDYTLG